MRNLVALFCILIGCSGGQSEDTMEEKPVLFYLHGMIVENQGANARHPEYGSYEYENILESFRSEGFHVISEIRPANTDINDYATKVVAQINELIEQGTDPGQITVVGASKGSMIAMVASTQLRRNDVNFVFMAACNEWSANNLSLSPCGRILSIYEESDEIGRTCDQIVGARDCVSEYKEIRLENGMKHGFLFKPLPEWVEPAAAWARVESKP